MSAWFDSGRAFLELVSRADAAGQPIEVRELVVLLDRMVSSRWSCSMSPRDPEWLVDPDLDYQEQHVLFSRLLPDFGFYEMFVGAKAMEQERVVFDAIEDLCDVWCEIKRTEILLAQHGDAVASDYYAWSFDVHWERHVRSVQLAFLNERRP